MVCLYLADLYIQIKFVDIIVGQIYIICLTSLHDFVYQLDATLYSYTSITWNQLLVIHYSSYTKWLQCMLLTFLMNLNQKRWLLWTNRHICTSTCIVFHKLCEIHHAFQREYITKLITHFPVQFNYFKIMKYRYL